MLDKLLKEVLAIQDCYSILSKLDQEGQERVVGYLLSIMEIEPPFAPPADDFDEEDADLEDD